MKRWMISACLTLVVLFLACLLCTDFNSKKEFYSSPQADNSSFVAVMTTVKRKKETAAKPQKQNTIKMQSDVISSPKEKEEQKKEETQTEELLDDEPQETTQTDKSDFDFATDFEAGEESEVASAVQKTGAQIKAEESYKAYALKRIASKKSYPLKARATGQEGSVKLHVIIGLKGELELAEIVQPCEHELLNEAALLAVKNSAPFKKKPDTMQKLELNFFMEFKLTG